MPLGAQVTKHTVLARVHARDEAQVQQAVMQIHNAYGFNDQYETLPVIYETITGDHNE